MKVFVENRDSRIAHKNRPGETDPEIIEKEFDNDHFDKSVEPVFARTREDGKFVYVVQTKSGDAVEVVLEEKIDAKKAVKKVAKKPLEKKETK